MNRHSSRMTTTGALLTLVLAAGPILGPVSQARALGLSTPFGEVIVNGCPVGMEINVRQIARRPYRVINTSLQPVNVEVQIYRPPDQRELREGYELLPASVTVRLSRYEFTLAPGQEGVADLWVEFPKDARYLGKKYEVQIWARTKALEHFIGVGVISRLLVHTADTLLTPTQVQRVKEITAALEFNVTPAQITLTDVPLGVEVSAKERYKKQFKIVNFNEEPLKIGFRHLERSRMAALMPKDHEPGPQEFLKLEKSYVEIPPNTIGEIPFTLRIPEGPKHRGRRYYFIVEAVLDGYEVPVSAYGRVAVETQKEAKAR